MSTYYAADCIFTGADETTFATAFAVEDGRFTWVGERAEIPADAEVVELDGPVVPGLIDAHTHATYVSLLVDAVPCTVPDVTDIPGMIAALRAHPNAGRGPTAWIEGWGYDESKLAEGRTPTRHDLDLVSTEQPVYVLRSDCHSGICNTRALELAGITRDTPDPEGAQYGRDADGEPNGVLTEHGANQTVMQAKGSSGYAAEVAKLAAAGSHFSERGLVGVTDMMIIPTEEFDPRDLFRDAARAGLKQSVRFYLDYVSLRARPLARPLTEDDRTGRVAVAGIKLFADGSMSNRTAWLRDPYPGTSDEYGYSTAPEEVMTEALAFARENHLQIAFHAMGDRAIEAIIDFYGHEQPWLEDVPSVRIEHATLMDAELARKAAAATMTFGVASNVDFFFAEYDSYSQNLSPEQMTRTYAVKDLYENVEALALTSDCPATTWADPDDPFMSIGAAVNRVAYDGSPITPEQAITVPQALLLYTSRARRLVDLPGLGEIRPGNEASFATLSQDVFAIEPMRLFDTTITGTWIAGERVHPA